MLFPAAAAPQSPIEFGPYLLTECVGQGGMAVVYKATRQGPSGFAKTVVVKAMLPTLSAQREFVAMFSAEARLMAALTHPNIVQVQDFGVIEGNPYLVMEYLAGRNLSQLRAALAAKKMKLPVGAALTIAREMCHGLGYAHDFVDGEGKRRRVIHRDVSPSNVMVCRDGSVKLLDFGVAKIVGEFEFDVTQSLKGKYAYMAPEQVSHQPVDCRVDVFAAGVVLHELLTGKRLFAANTELETLQRVSQARVVAPSVDNREVPRALDAIVKKALARDPGDRYATGTQLVEALETLDGLAWTRKRLATLMAELFAHEWMVVCEVCGKTVMPSSECQECGTRAPDLSVPMAIAERADEAAFDGDAPSEGEGLGDYDFGPVPVGLAASNTERNAVGEEPLPLLPTSTSEPLPLPPPPLTPVPPRRAPKTLPNDEPRRRLQVVRTPLPPPMAPASSLVPAVNRLSPSLATMASQAHGLSSPASSPASSSPSPSPFSSSDSQASSSQASLSQASSPPFAAQASSPETSEDLAPTIEEATLPPAAPPRLFVVPRTQGTQAEPSPGSSESWPSLSRESSLSREPSPSLYARRPLAEPNVPLSDLRAPRDARGPLSDPRSPFDTMAAPRSSAPHSTFMASPSTTGLVLRRTSNAPLVILAIVIVGAALAGVFAMTPDPLRVDPAAAASTTSTAAPAARPAEVATTVPTPSAAPNANVNANANANVNGNLANARTATNANVNGNLANARANANANANGNMTGNANTNAAASANGNAVAGANGNAVAGASGNSGAGAQKTAHANVPARPAAVAHRRAAHVARPVVTDERSVKEGRIVDPFAELK